MDLKRMNLVELNTQEVKVIEGGFLPILIGVCLLLSGCAARKPEVDPATHRKH